MRRRADGLRIMLTLDRQNAYRNRLRSLWPGWRPATEVYEAAVRRHLIPGTHLLDVGCGRGGVVEQVAGEAITLTGIDPDRRSLAEHRLPPERMGRAVAWLETVPFPTNTFDLVISSWVLEHLAEPEAAWNEIGRVLHPGGHLVILTPNLRHPVTWLNQILARSKSLQGALVPRLYGRAEGDAFPVRYQSNSVPQIERLATRAGLMPVVIETIADPTYLAFSEPLFKFGCRLERLMPAAAGVHIVADLVRR
jgi:ubiquinone/menaquinone biosynthesis C-methylase UbiE